MVTQHTSMWLDARKVLTACYWVQEEIFLEREEKLDKLVSMFSGEIRSLFGLVQCKPETDRAATLEWLESNEPFFHNKAQYHRSSQLAVVQSIGHLIHAGLPGDKRVWVSAQDYSYIHEHWGKSSAIVERKTQERRARERGDAEALVRRIATGHVLPQE